MVDYSLVSVNVTETGHFQMAFMRPDGLMHKHTVPTIRIDSLAGEYGFDPVKDRDTLIDLLLHEPFMEPIPEEQTDRDSRGLPSKRGDKIHLFNAPTIEAARKSHLDRLAHTKTNNINVVWDDVKAAQPLRDHKANPDGVEAHRTRVFRARGRLGREKLPPPTPPKPIAYDPAIRRRGVTVALLDVPRE